MATRKKPYTRHKITDSALKQLAAAVNREDGSLYPGIGAGAPASRGALVKRGLAKEVYIDAGTEPCSYCQSNRYDCWHNGGRYDTQITEAGREALADARREGW